MQCVGYSVSKMRVVATTLYITPPACWMIGLCFAISRRHAESYAGE